MVVAVAVVVAVVVVAVVLSVVWWRYVGACGRVNLWRVWLV